MKESIWKITAVSFQMVFSNDLGNYSFLRKWCLKKTLDGKLVADERTIICVRFRGSVAEMVCLSAALAVLLFEAMIGTKDAEQLPV